jgi:hypothetical protein
MLQQLGLTRRDLKDLPDAPMQGARHNNRLITAQQPN